MHFIAVADLARIAQFDESGLLPSTGRLYFFFDGLAGAFDLADPAAARVVYTDADDDLHVPPRFRPSHPDDSGYAIPAVFAELACVEPWTQWTIPPHDETCFEGIDWYRYDNADSAFWRQWSHLEPVSYLTPQMLGWPTPEQGSMTYELPAGGDWRLLLQVPAWDGGLTWADVASLYYWIRDSDLRRGHFDDVRAILQF